MLIVAAIFVRKLDDKRVVIRKLTDTHVEFFRPGENRRRRLTKQMFLKRYEVAK